MERLALHTSHQVALASHIVRMNIARYVAYFLTYFLVGLLGLLAVLVVWSSAPWPGRLMPWTLALCILAATAFLSALCMSGKQHSERRRGFGHDRLPVATGSPQALRIRNRE